MQDRENRAPPVKVGRVFSMKMFNFETGKPDGSRHGIMRLGPIWYRKRPFAVRKVNGKVSGTGNGPLPYGMPRRYRSVQETIPLLYAVPETEMKNLDI